jgi:superfamily I DNA and RNA helicase
LDIVVSNQRVLCSGGAGTGKTFLAVELAKRLASTDKSLVFVCKSSWLRFYLQSIIINEFVTISTIDSVAVDMKRSGLDRYDVLIVDEGQDLFEYSSIDSLDALLKGGLSDGEWYIFHDVNNQSGLFSETNPEVLQLLESYSPAKIPLNKNCRNTLPIINTIKNLLNLDMGSQGTGFGPEVQFLFESSNSAKSLEDNLSDILDNGVASGSITILSPYSYEQSSVNLLPEKIKSQIINLDDYSIRTFPLSTISFSEIKNFKGLENDIIIVVDLAKPTKEKNRAGNVLHYVAMTRARSLLCVIWS